MQHRLSKIIGIGVLAVSLSLGFATIGLADDMGGMNMGSMNMGGNTLPQNAPASQPPSQQPNNPMPGMDNSNNMPNEKHEATSGMDPNMPGMESDGHGDTDGASQGANPYVVGGFSLANFLIIGTAGVLKFAKMLPGRL